MHSTVRFNSAIPASFHRIKESAYGTLVPLTSKITAFAKEILPYTADLLFASASCYPFPRLFIPFLLIPLFLASSTRQITWIVAIKIAINTLFIANYMLEEEFLKNEYIALAIHVMILLNQAHTGTSIVTQAASNLYSDIKTPQKSLTKKVTLISGSMIMIASGAFTIHATYHSAIRFFSGLRVFLTLDQEQKNSALHYRAIAALGSSKKCHAVIFDSRETGMSEVESVLYENCHVKGYRVRSPKQFCQRLAEAAERFQHPIDILSLAGHGSPNSLLLSTYYPFKGSSEEIDCMERYLSPEAQVLLLGCNTAKPDTTVLNKPHMTQKISHTLPKKKIIGATGNIFSNCMRANFFNQQLIITFLNIFNDCQVVSYIDGRPPCFSGHY